MSLIYDNVYDVIDVDVCVTIYDDLVTFNMMMFVSLFIMILLVTFMMMLSNLIMMMFVSLFMLL